MTKCRLELQVAFERRMEAAEAEKRSEMTAALRLESERHEAVAAAAAEGRVVEAVARLERPAQEQREAT